MVLSDKEKQVLNETHLRNLKRRYTKLLRHPEFAEECIDLKNEIDTIEKQL